MRTNLLLQDLLSLVRYVRAAPEHHLHVDHLRSQFRGLLGRMHGHAQTLGMAAGDADEIGYAMVALIDEVVLGRADRVSAEWMRQQLQYALFGENTAGEGFYVRLGAIRRDPRRAEVLAAYYLAMACGFRGQYAHHELAWQDLFESVRLDLQRYGVVREVALAPHGVRPRDAVVQRADGRVVLALGVSALVLAGLFYVGLYADLALRVAALSAG